MKTWDFRAPLLGRITLVRYRHRRLKMPEVDSLNKEIEIDAGNLCVYLTRAGTYGRE